MEPKKFQVVLVADCAPNPIDTIKDEMVKIPPQHNPIFTLHAFNNTNLTFMSFPLLMPDRRKKAEIERESLRKEVEQGGPPRVWVGMGEIGF